MITTDHGGSFGDGVIDNRRRFLYRLTVNKRAKVYLALEAIAHGKRRHTLAEMLDELIVNRFMHQNAIGGKAVLPSGLELGINGRKGRLFGIHIRPNDKRRIATQLQGKPLDGISTLLNQQPAHPGGTGERQRPNTRFAAEDL